MPSPTTISRFEVKRELGHGGMGLLYLALDPLIDRLVAEAERVAGQVRDDPAGGGG